jgi:Domain of unknown function (DUF4129)
MTQGRPRASDRFTGADGYQLGRLALAALLIVTAAALLRGGLPALSLDGPYVHDVLPVAAGLEGVIIVLLAAVVVRHGRAPAGHLLAARLREVLRSVLIVAAIAVPCGYLVTRAVHLKIRAPVPVQPARSQLPARRGIPAAPHPAPWSAGLADLILAAVLVAAIVGCVILLLRRHRPRRRAAWRPEPEPADLGEAELRKAVEYGWLALRELDDARGAIIACYLAMEQSLAQAGTTRGIAETPDELLARAAATGLVRGPAAARLTSAFYAARFSTMELTAAHRDTAEQALAELADGLAGAAT